MHAAAQTNLENTVSVSSSQAPKGHMLYESICMKCPERRNPERQRADPEWLPGAGAVGGGEGLRMGPGFPLPVKMSGSS